MRRTSEVSQVDARPAEDDRERRLREAAVAKVTRQPPEPAEPDEDEERDPAHDRIEQQALWVDHQVRAAMERGEFDDLPGAGKPLKLPDRHDPDWWVKGLIEREKITGVLPAALALRREDAQLDAELDRLGSEAEVRRTVADFNRRVVEARRQLQGGPPVVTPTRDVEQELAAWQARRRARRNPDSSALPDGRAAGRSQTNRGWRFWRRKSGESG